MIDDEMREVVEKHLLWPVTTRATPSALLSR